MKTLILSICAVGSAGFLFSCAEDEHHGPRTISTTTTEETTVSRPQGATVETTTYRAN